GFNDLVEFTYGLNPNNPDQSDVVNNALLFEDLRVDEVGSPILQLPFEESAGPAFNDISGQENAALCEADQCPLAQVAGRYGPGLYFDGVSDVLTVDGVDLANQSFTIASWVKRDAEGRNDFIVSQGVDTVNQGLHFGFRANDKFTCAFWDNGLNTTLTYTDSDWHHWACSYDAATNQRIIYRDGVQVAQDTASADYEGSGSLYIGWRIPDNNGNYFAGSMDDVTVYNHALSIDEVADLRDGRYHLNNLVVVPGADLTYQVTAENNLLGRTASGHFYAAPESLPSPLNVDTGLQSFTLDPLEAITLSGDVDVNASAADGVYPLNLTAEGAINADESELFITLPDPDMGIYFETNQFGATPNEDFIGTLGDNVFATCPLPLRYGNHDCPAFDEGLNGRGLSFEGSDQSVLIEGIGDNSLNLIDGDFTVSAWVYPNSELDNDTKHAILGYYDPDELWFDFRDNADNSAFYDEAGSTRANCSGSECPSSTVHQTVFDGIDDRLVIPDSPHINLQTVENLSLLIDFNIARVVPSGIPGTIFKNMVLYEQGGTDAGINIFADRHSSSGAQMHVCAWDLNGDDYSYGPSCVDFSVFPGIDRRLIVTFDGGDPSTSTGGEMRVYLDGVLIGSAFTFDVREHTNNIGVGGVAGATRLKTGTIFDGAFFEGTINTLAYFPKTLTESEVEFYADNYYGEVFPTLYLQGNTVGMAFKEGDPRNLFDEVATAYGRLEPFRWSHVAMTFDDLNDEVTLYHNGVEVINRSTQVDLPVLANPQLRLGWAGGRFDNFPGLIDSVVFYDDVLTGDEIADVSSLIFNENNALHFEFDEVPGSSEFQYGYALGDFAICTDSQCPTSGLRGQVNWSATFDGDDQLLAYPDFGDAEVSAQQFSIATWVKGSEGTILDHPITGIIPGSIRLELDRFRVANNLGSEKALNFSGVSADEWVHLVAVYDAANEMRIYINGIEIASTTVPIGSVELDTSDPYVIGSRLSGNVGLIGELDDLRFYHMALTPNQVTDLYERTTPLLQFRFDEDELTTHVFDDSPNEFIGEVKNAQPGVDGRLGNAVRFTHNGGSQRSTVFVNPITQLADITDNFTVMMWLKSDAFNLQGTETVVGWEHTQLQINRSADSKSYVMRGGGTTDDLPQNLGQWEHLAVSVDSSGNMRYYLNGVLVKTTVFDEASFSDGKLSFGEEFGTAASGVFDTTLDEFSFYKRALSGLEIADQYRIDARWYRAVGTFRITVDTDNPTVELRSNATYWENQSTVLDVMTSDATTAVTLVDMGIKAPSSNDFVWQGASACQDAEAGMVWCPTFDPTQFDGEGVYELKFRAVDAAGNESMSSSNFLFVDATGPTISVNNSGTFNSPVRQNKNEWHIPLSGTVSDPNLVNGSGAGSGVVADTVMVTLYEEDGDVAGAGIQSATVNNGNWSLDYLFNGSRPNGLFTIELIASDEVGNETIQMLGTLRIDGRSSRIDLYADPGINENVPSATQPEVVSDADFAIAPTEVMTTAHSLAGTVSDLPELAGARLSLHFEDDGADGFLDSSGWGHSASCNNCPTAVSGLFGQALDFDGVDGVLTIDSIESLNIGPALTFSAWVNPDVIPATGNARFMTLSQGKAVIRISNGDLNFYMNLDDEFRHVRVSDVLVANQYQHIAGTYDGTTMRVYYNGILVGETIATGAVDESSSVAINSGGASFDGQMDEIMIFDRALPENEIYDLAQGTVATVATLETSFELLGDSSLLAELPMPDGVRVYLPFNEVRLDDPVTTFADYSSFDTFVACDINGPTCPETGAVGQEGDALLFDGQDDFLRLALYLDPSEGPFTAATWINSDEIGSDDQVILSKRGGGSSWLGIRTEGTLFSELGGNALTSSEIISPNRWHHVAVIYDGLDLHLYLDGQLVGSEPRTMESSTGEMRIGVSRSGNKPFNGRIDELAIFDRALSLAELHQVMIDGRPVLSVDFDDEYAVHGDALTVDGELPLEAFLVGPDGGNLIAPGHIGSGALDLQDGATEYAIVATNPLLDLSHGQYSQVAWIYPQPNGNS
ncbi:MAG: LamG domain-containing protein, partial [Chloroflexota bacterium]